jgi:hypothetical protein
MGNPHDCYRILAAQVVAVGSAATFSTAVMGSQTRYVRLAHATSSVGTIFYNNNSTVVDSTSGALLPYNWIEIIKCNPGERIFARADGVTTVQLNVAEMTD